MRTPAYLVIVLAVTLVNSALAQPLKPSVASGDENDRPAGGASIPVDAGRGTEVLGAENTATSSGPPTISIEEPIDPDQYVCGAGDVFEVNFWGQQNFRLKIAADLEGRTFISKVGFVEVAGKTLSGVRGEVRKRVRSVYPGLQFELTLISPRTFLVHVANNVKQPGIFAARALDRVSTVLARAGGITGSKRLITVRNRSGKEVTVDLLLYELTGDKTQNPYLLDGDVITVPFASMTVSIVGAVKRPGSYELVRSKDLDELLQIAGGFTSSVARSLPIRITKQNEKQQEVTSNVAVSDKPNHPLNDGEAVFVPTIDELQRSVLLIGAVVGADAVDAATTSRRLPFIEGDTVRSLIERAGGISAPGDLSRAYIARPKEPGSPELIPIDLEALLVKRDFREDRKIQMNDTIVVPPMRYSVLVEGAVGRAGLYTFNPQFGIRQYLALAGGRSRTARDLDEVELIGADGKTRSFSSEIRPSPGDTILVPERNFTRAEVVQIVLAGAGLLVSGIAITLAATR
jgi:polysaccharide biosynthesis/export protein